MTPETLAGNAARRVQLELAVLGAVYADPRALVPVATAAGVTVYSFEHEDTRALWLAAQVIAEHPAEDRYADRTRLAGLAVPALRRIGCWDPRAVNPPELSARWGEAALVGLLGACYPCPVVTGAAAGALAGLIRDLREAAEHFAYARDLAARHTPAAVEGRRLSRYARRARAAGDEQLARSFELEAEHAPAVIAAAGRAA